MNEKPSPPSGGWASGTTTAASASACQVTQDWDSDTIMWSNRPNANTLIGTTENKLSDVDTYALWSIYWVTDGYVFKSGQINMITYPEKSTTNENSRYFLGDMGAIPFS